MKAVIVAGGKGTRLYPYTRKTPKTLLKVGKSPVLEHIINFLKDSGICEIILSVGYLRDQIISYFGNGKKFGVNISYIYDYNPYPLGTAGSIIQAKNKLKDRFIVVYGDTLRELNLKNMLSFHIQNKSVTTIAVYKNFSPDPKSKIDFNNINRITSFLERPAKQSEKFVWSNSSLYILEPSVLNYIPPDKYLDFGKDLFPELIQKGERLYVFKSNQKFIDIGDKNKLRSIQNYFN